MIKKIQLFLMLALVVGITSCSDPKPESELKAKCEALMDKFHNYESNDIAYKAINDSVASFCESFVGKEATLLKGIEFDYIEMYDNHDNGTHAALFRGREYCEIDAKSGKTKYIISSPQVLVLGTVSEEQAATLDNNQKYSISGTVHAWDGKNMLGHEGVMTHADLSFGTFILNPITVSKIEK